MIYYLMGLFAVFGYALLPVLAKKAQTDIPSFAFIAITMAFLSVFSLAASLIQEKDFSFSTISLGTLTQLGVFALINLIAFFVMLITISKIPIVEYQLIAMLTPVIGGILAYFILAEGLSPKYFIGMAFIAVGLVIALKK